MTTAGGPPVGHGIAPDPRAILAALGQPPPDAVAPLAGGWDTAIWRVDVADASYALRLFRPEQARAAAFEAMAIRAAAAAGVPAPDVRATSTWQERPAMLLSWCPGRTLAAELQMHPWRVWRLGLQFGRTQALLHRAPVLPELRAASRSWIDWCGPEQAALQAALRALPTSQSVLLHLDYHVLNVMTDGQRITCVVDWINARVGDRRADAARTLAIIRLMPAPPGAPRPLVALLRRLLELAYRRGYVTTRHEPLEGMAPFHAWAGAVLLRDLTPKLGRPGIPLTPADMARVERWTNEWKRRAGIAS